MFGISSTIGNSLARKSPAVLMVAIVLVVAGCGSAAQSATQDPTGPSAEGTPQETPDGEPVSVVFRLDWTIGGEHTPYVLGIEKGFFRDEGLDVELQEGTGSAETVQIVGAGSVDFGNADTPPVVLGIQQGIPVKMVANFSPTSSFILQWVEGRTDLESLADLRGLTIGVHQGSTEASILPYLLETNGLSEDDVTIVQGPPPTSMYVALVQDRIDVRMGLASSIPEIQQLDPSLDFGALFLADHGIELQAHGIIVNETFLEEQPDVVGAFVRAAQRSWQYVLESEAHQQEAIQITLDQFPAGADEALDIGLADHLDTLRGAAPSGQPLGWMDAERWEQSQELIQVLFPEEAESELSVSEYYTTEFLSEDIGAPS